MGGKGKGKKEKRARPSSSTGDELEEDGRHYGKLLALYKALEQKDALSQYSSIFASSIQLLHISC